MKLVRTSVCALVLGTLIMLAFSSVTAYPILENGHDSYDPPPYIPPTSPPPAAPPALPDCGYFTVDCPSGGWMVNYSNAYDEYAAVHRNGPSTWLSYGEGNSSQISRGWFPDSSQAYNWPKQTMPLANSSILSVYLIAVCQKMAGFSMASPVAYLQYSIDGQDHYYPALYTPNDTFTITNLFGYIEYVFNVTTYQDWTPQMLLSSQTWVRIWVEGLSLGNYVLVDYVGLKYNWTFTGAPPSGPGSDWKNSTLGKITFGQMLVGGIGVIGFIGMILVPPVGIVLARTAENKMVLLVGMTIWMLLSFGLFMAGVS